tara:strand:+ start:1419 stop:1556 length:138 start_codon:yes stop_codon:yes gene_type:complete
MEDDMVDNNLIIQELDFIYIVKGKKFLTEKEAKEYLEYRKNKEKK